jgi:hypothetical protein
MNTQADKILFPDPMLPIAMRLISRYYLRIQSSLLCLSLGPHF